ncbi:MAG: sugar phosphate isomerase/epimerase [Deltaproteobacteria bacterium]|nr:sugar phosphate isomerase/epimerase [Deltaproteobacteria bacterium]
MILGYSTNAFVKYTLPDSLKRIADLKFKGVEIMCDRPHLYPPDYRDSDLLEIKNTIKGLGLKITNLNSFTLFAVGDTYLPSWIESDPNQRKIRIQHTLACLGIAKELGCGNISIPPGGPLSGMSQAEAIRIFHQGLDQVIPLAESLNVKLLIEPEPDLLMENSAQFKAFIRDIRSAAVGLNFDIGHFFCAGEEPHAAFEDLFEWIGHVHVEDIAPSRVHNHLIVGQGAICFSKIFEAMMRLGYACDISLELYPYAEMPDEAGRRSLACLLPLMRDAGLIINSD